MKTSHASSSQLFKHPSTQPLMIFDWDGTLMDSIGTIVESIQHAARFLDWRVSDSKARSVIGLSLDNALLELFPHMTLSQKQQLLASYAQYQQAQADVRMFAGMKSFLQQLKLQGKTLAVATGKSRKSLDRMLSYTQTDPLFAATATADESGSKPHPQMLLDVLKQTGHRVDEAVFVGDSHHDIDMANAMGMMSVGVCYGAMPKDKIALHQPSYLVDTPRQLQDLLLIDGPIKST